VEAAEAEALMAEPVLVLARMALQRQRRARAQVERPEQAESTAAMVLGAVGPPLAAVSRAAEARGARQVLRRRAAGLQELAV